MSSQANTTIDHGATPPATTAGTSRSAISPVVPIIGVVLAVLGIMAIVAFHAWWATALAIVIESIVLGLVVVSVQRATTSRRGVSGEVIALANSGEGQTEMSEHDVPVGAPERQAVRHHHAHDGTAAAPR